MTPKESNFYFPAEWHPHKATWLSWPHKEASWPGKLSSIYKPYCQFIKIVASKELVCINVANNKMEQFARQHLLENEVDINNIQFYHHPTNDAWCRDHGPAFLINKNNNQKAIIDFGYNAWGNKYPPFDLDDIIPTLVAQKLNLQLYTPPIIMEGGSVDFNGAGALLTSKSCLLNQNRNPHLSQLQIEEFLIQYYGVDQILWVDDGIVGDDTDGHIDDTIRFVNHNTVIAAVETNKSDDNYSILQYNLLQLKKMKLLDNTSLNIVELPMPREIVCQGQRLPASYANFYIANAAVIVPTFRDKNDEKALQIIASCFADRPTIGVDSLDVIWGLGSWHCLSQQEPEANTSN
jgi:agmatine deiminase